MAVHPRWRGEHKRPWAYVDAMAGSSPLARGTHLCGKAKNGVSRFIPAGAGNTGTARACGLAIPVHPRWRGEHQIAFTTLSISGGSSPLARGTRVKSLVSRDFIRFIPAGAGNTQWAATARYPGAVHPRWRGEHRRIPFPMASMIGSSPLARGTPSYRTARTWSHRFIPAGAGNTSKIASTRGTSTVHPRWRGEHKSAQLRRGRRGGSSPLARGTRPSRTPRPACCRFIPAGAGNTLTLTYRLARAAVHPRWRGEHF